MKNDEQPIRDSVPWYSRYTRDPRCLNTVFLFSTEIRADQSKKPPCTNTKTNTKTNTGTNTGKNIKTNTNTHRTYWNEYLRESLLRSHVSQASESHVPKADTYVQFCTVMNHYQGRWLHGLRQSVSVNMSQSSMFCKIFWNILPTSAIIRMDKIHIAFLTLSA